jgi:hypothetical protein
MRRLKYSRIKEFSLCVRSVEKDAELVPLITYGEPMKVKGEIWPERTRRQLELYGDRIDGIQSVWLQGRYEKDGDGYKINGVTFHLGDGVCVDSKEPNYEILSFTPYKLLKMEIERI